MKCGVEGGELGREGEGGVKGGEGEGARWVERVEKVREQGRARGGAKGVGGQRGEGPRGTR